MQKINYKYKIKYKRIETFEFKKINNIVEYTTYKDYLEIAEAARRLNEDKHSRQAILTINRGYSHLSCFISAQFQIRKKTLYVTVNFRSQHKLLGRPTDEILINYLTTHIIDALKYKIKKVKITVNVGNYHIY
jgi:thymidylate synthase